MSCLAISAARSDINHHLYSSDGIKEIAQGGANTLPGLTLLTDGQLRDIMSEGKDGTDIADQMRKIKVTSLNHISQKRVMDAGWYEDPRTEQAVRILDAHAQAKDPDTLAKLRELREKNPAHLDSLGLGEHAALAINIDRHPA